jgi:ribosomal protein S18 acetylase RimI-like enzyme
VIGSKEMDVKIRLLQEEDIEPIATAFQNIGWNKPPSQYQRYLLEQQEGHRMVLVAFDDDRFAGYLTVVWSSDYQPFRAENIPEIQDLNVLPQVRRMGVGTQLMTKAEELIAERSSVAGIGVGMTGDYGAAQRLYVRRGYKPDGSGLVWRNEAVKYGQQIIVDDDLVLYFVKPVAA